MQTFILISMWICVLLAILVPAVAQTRYRLDVGVYLRNVFALTWAYVSCSTYCMWQLLRHILSNRAVPCVCQYKETYGRECTILAAVTVHPRDAVLAVPSLKSASGNQYVIVRTFYTRKL